MSTLLEQQLRAELRGMADTEPAAAFDARSVLAAGRAARARRRLAWAAGGVAAAIVVTALAVVVRPAQTALPPPVDPAGTPTAGPSAAVQRVDERLLPELEHEGFEVMTGRPYYVQAGTGYAYWEVTRAGESYWVMLSALPSPGANSLLDRCHGPKQNCHGPRVSTGPGTDGSTAWRQTVTDIGTRDDPLAGGRVLRRSFPSGHVVEIAVTAAENRALAADELSDAEIAVWADAIGDPFPS